MFNYLPEAAAKGTNSWLHSIFSKYFPISHIAMKWKQHDSGLNNIENKFQNFEKKK